MDLSRRQVFDDVPAPNEIEHDRGAEQLWKQRQRTAKSDVAVAQHDDAEARADQGEQDGVRLLEVDQCRGHEAEAPGDLRRVGGAAAGQARQQFDPEQAERADHNHGCRIGIGGQHHRAVEPRIDDQNRRDGSGGERHCDVRRRRKAFSPAHGNDRVGKKRAIGCEQGDVHHRPCPFEETPREERGGRDGERDRLRIARKARERGRQTAPHQRVMGIGIGGVGQPLPEFIPQRCLSRYGTHQQRNRQDERDPHRDASGRLAPHERCQQRQACNSEHEGT